MSRTETLQKRLAPYKTVAIAKRPKVDAPKVDTPQTDAPKVDRSWDYRLPEKYQR